MRTVLLLFFISLVVVQLCCGEDELVTLDSFKSKSVSSSLAISFFFFAALNDTIALTLWSRSRN